MISNFRYFHKFMAGNEVFLVPRDHADHDSVCFSNELLLAVISGRQKDVFDYDFTEVEA